MEFPTSRLIIPDRKGLCITFAHDFDLIEEAGVGVAPGVDFGQMGKGAVRFSCASSEENLR